MFAPVTITMFGFEGLALSLLVFLGLRYRDNLRTLHIRSPKQLWSCLFAGFLFSAFVSMLLLWCVAFIKCLDTSDSLVKALGVEGAARECQPWQFLSRRNKLVIFVVYYTFTSGATVLFQLLVLERYRKISSLFPKQIEKYGLTIYLSIYSVATLLGFVLGIVELYASPTTIISRKSTLNTLSSISYCIWVASTGITDALLGFVIVTNLRKGRREMVAEGSSQGLVIAKLGTLQKLFVLIVIFDCSIVTLTSIKKTDSHIIQGHAFAWDIGGIEITTTIVHTTLTLCFMQMLASVLASTQPQFDFVVRNKDPKSPPLTQGQWGQVLSRPKLATITVANQAGFSSTEKAPQMHELDCSGLGLVLQHDDDASYDRRGTVVTFNSSLSKASSTCKSPTAFFTEHELEEADLIAPARKSYSSVGTSPTGGLHYSPDISPAER